MSPEVSRLGSDGFRAPTTHWRKQIVIQSDSTPQPEVSVVIVNWNTREFLQQTLASLYRETTTVSFEVIVVDNGSSDGSANLVRRSWPLVRLIASPSNLGFTGGNNAGIRLCRGQYILFLNSDTVVLPSTVSGMAAFLRSHPGTGCVGCQHLNPDGSLQRSMGHFPSLLEDFLAYTELHRLPLLRPFLRRKFAYWGSHARAREVDWVNGACFMVRSQVVDQVGGFDEDYFIYGDELDWCYRMRRAGWVVQYIPEAQVIHYGGQAMNKVPSERLVRRITSQYRFYRKHYTSRRRFAWRAMVSIVSVGRIGLTSLLLFPLMVLPVSAGTRRKWWEVIARESVMTAPQAVIAAWWRILVFAAIKPELTSVPLHPEAAKGHGSPTGGSLP